MSSDLSWLRRVRRTLRVCCVSLALLVIWSLLESVLSLPRPVLAAPLLLVFGLTFVWWYWIRPRRLRRRRGPADLRLRSLRPGMRGPLAVAIIVACLGAEVLYLLHLRFLPIPGEDPFADFFSMAQQPWGALVVFVFTVVLAPVMEETVFRGWIQRPLERLWGPVPAILITASLFSAVHLIPEYLPYYFAVGVLLGGFVVVTRSLWSAVLLHAAYNAQSTTLALLGPGDFYNEVATAQQPFVVAWCFIVLIGSGVFLARTARELRMCARPLRVSRIASTLRLVDDALLQ